MFNKLLSIDTKCIFSRLPIDGFRQIFSQLLAVGCTKNSRFNVSSRLHCMERPALTLTVGCTGPYIRLS